jgi:CRISPR system Cascade subunit CasE
MPIPNESLHLIRLSIDARGLYAFAARSRAGGPDIDVGYAVHALLGALFDHGADPGERVAPKPFAVGDEARGVLDVHGYSALPHQQLVERAKQFADPLAWGASDLSGMVSRPMPTEFVVGTRLGFEARVCPTRRVKKRGPMTRETAEVDAYLARLWASDEADASSLDREAIYREWLGEQLGRDGAAELEAAQMTGFQGGQFLRRTQGEHRKAHRTGRPDVRFRGVLVVKDARAFASLLARGLGRHRSFGFGMLLLRPAGAMK